MCLGKTPKGNFIKGHEKKEDLPRLRQRVQSSCGEFRGGGVGFLELTKGLRTGTYRWLKVKWQGGSKELVLRIVLVVWGGLNELVLSTVLVVWGRVERAGFEDGAGCLGRVERAGFEDSTGCLRVAR